MPFNPSPNLLLIRLQQRYDDISDSKRQIIAPTALSIPISFFLLVIEMLIKLNNNNVENKAKMIPAYKKILVIISKKLST